MEILILITNATISLVTGIIWLWLGITLSKSHKLFDNDHITANCDRRVVAALDDEFGEEISDLLN